MSKNLINALQKGNLKPKDRVLLLVHNAVKKETTGKELLSEAEKHAISDGWQPTDNEQVKEYNRYNQGWKVAGFAELDAQTVFLETQVIYFQERQASNHLILYPLFRKAKRWFDNLKNIKPVTIEQANEIVKKQREVKLKGGIDYDRAVYELAFELSDKPVREDLVRLYPEAETDTQYLDEEEILYDLFKGKKELTTEDKDKLTDIIVKNAYNKYAKEWQLWHFYASIPLKEIGKRWLDTRGVKVIKPNEYGFNEALKEAKKEVEKAQKREITTEEAIKEYTAENLAYTLEGYAKDHKTTIEAELKEVTREWLDNGLLTEYEPIFKSTGKKTYGEDTKLPHNELFRIWLEAKAKARETLDSLIKEKKLQKEDDTLTGDSLYAFKGDFQFIKDHNKYVDEYDANLGIVYEDNDPDHKGHHLDRELLITDLDEKGKPYGINFSQMALSYLESYFDVMGFVKERKVNGERIVEFSVDIFTELMKNTTEGLKKKYAILLSFQELFRRLSKTYDIDLNYKINKWVKLTESFIDNHNEAIKTATEKDFTEITDNTPVRLKDDLYIDKDKITPDTTRLAEYFKELEETLGDDF